MRNRLTVVLILTAGLVFCLVFARQLIRSRDISREGWIDTPVRVLTYATMVSARGAAEIIFKRFELEHHAKLEVVVSTDVGLMLERLKYGGPFDLVIGLDQLLLDRARAEFKWRAVEVDRAGWFEAPAAASDEHFVAIDWSPLTFIYRRDDQPLPRSIDDLTAPQFKAQFTLPDPRATTPGVQFARWINAARGAGARAWLENFRPNVKTVTPSWTAGYALFEKRQTRFVWTYLTSLAFHWGVEKNRDYQPLIFTDGHPAQVETAAIPSDCRACDLGEALMRTLLTRESQEELMKRNFMMPVLRGVEAGTAFAELPALKINPVRATADELNGWDEVFAR